MNDLLVRELMNGMWFVLSLEVLVALMIYIVRRAFHDQGPARSVWIEPEVWYRQPGTQLAFAWLVYMSGSAMRAGWVWILLECQNRSGVGKCRYIVETVEVLFAASVFAIVGGVCTIRVMLPEEWRPWSYVVPGSLALIIPVVYNYAT